jgi:hypothetical protein
MNVIKVNLYPAQKQRLILPDGSSVTITLVFKPMQYGWFIKELTHLEFTLKGVRIVNSPNILQQFKNQIPFGIACYSRQNREPSLLEDFDSGNSTLYLMTEAEVEEFSSYIRG